MDKNDYIKTGGPAFPQQEYQQVGEVIQGKSTFGMTLRDYFAGQALHATIAMGLGDMSKKTEEEYKAEIAKNSYEYADAMINERNK